MDAWYYFNSDGRMATGMIEVGGLRYYDGVLPDGRMDIWQRQ